MLKRYGQNFPHVEFTHWSHRARVRQRGRNQCGRQLGSDDAAVGPHGMRGLPLRTAAVRAFGTGLEASAKRSDHQSHQENGNRHPSDWASQHEISLPLRAVLSVICITVMNCERRHGLRSGLLIICKLQWPQPADESTNRQARNLKEGSPCGRFAVP